MVDKTAAKPITAETGTQAMTRRQFLVRSTVIAGSGFFSIGMPALLSGSNARAAMATPAFTPAIWFTITPDGITTMHIVKAEMGQHIGTGLAQVIAEELEVDWADVRLDAPLESVENFSVYGLAYTVNSGSVTTEFDRIARAGAAESCNQISLAGRRRKRVHVGFREAGSAQARLQGGRVGLQSSVGKGSMFFAVLPKAQQPGKDSHGD